MKKVLLSITVVLSLIVSACNHQVALQENPNWSKVHPELFIDRDALVEIATVTKLDNFEAIEYTEEQMHQLKKVKQNKDYPSVVKRFVKEKLNTSISTFQTIKVVDHTRTLLVTTNDQRVYKVSLEKIDDIWLIKSYAEIEWTTYPVHP